MKALRFLPLLLLFPQSVHAKGGAAHFKQLGEQLPTPTEVRLASGAPGPEYWQQKVDYKIDVTLDDINRRLIGSEKIRYKNNSPHELKYLWVQLDQNSLKRDSDRSLVRGAPGFSKFSYRYMAYLLAREKYDGGVKLKRVEADGRPAKYTVVKTMMRIDLRRPLKAGQSINLRIDWEHNINNAREIWGRGGYEQFDEDGHRIYTIAQWFPRMAAYNDVDGWQNKQFIGRGEFTLELGDYDVRITAPEDHVVGATGVLQNAKKVLTKAQRKRLKKALKSDRPIFIVDKNDAIAASKHDPKKTKLKSKTWHFRAENVRDFAFASSRRFLWDAMGVQNGKERVLCMSYYPKEAEPLWFRYSSPAIAHTIEVYGRMTFPYPYPVAISVNGPIGGMEYPMISFNGPRAEKDGTYYAKASKSKRWSRTKYGLISVIIHEVGHNWFPMIINSDERQWTWMDEGLNTFLQFVTEREWEKDYPSRRGPPKNIIPYMKSENQVPIMTNSESILQFGNNAYGKPATALNILRETVMGREVFDFAFKTYANRWRFKRPMPADFFRTMEDASSVDLDWFWRGWFYGTQHVDISLSKVKQFVFESGDPAIDKPARKKEKDETEPPDLTQERNAAEGMTFRAERFPELNDFYNRFDKHAATEEEKDKFKKMVEKLEPWEKKLLETKRFFYVLDFENVGGLVSPVPLKVEYDNGTSETISYPAEVWRLNSSRISKLLMTKRPLKRLEIDPRWETADTDRSNNTWPAEPVKSRFKLFKKKYDKNEMQKARDWKKKKEKEKEKAKSKKKEAAK